MLHSVNHRTASGAGNPGSELRKVGRRKMCQDQHKVKLKVQPVNQWHHELLAASQTCVITGLRRGTSVPQVPNRSQAHLLHLVWEQSVFRKWFTALKLAKSLPGQCLRKPNYRVRVIHPLPPENLGAQWPPPCSFVGGGLHAQFLQRRKLRVSSHKRVWLDRSPTVSLPPPCLPQ